MTARKAFEALLRVSLLQPTSPKFNQFAEEVRKIAKQKYEYTFYEGEEVRDLQLLTWNYKLMYMRMKIFMCAENR